MAPVNKLFHIIQKRSISVEKSELSTFSLKQQEQLNIDKFCLLFNENCKSWKLSIIFMFYHLK